MRALVVGGNGFVGLPLVNALLKKGYTVDVLDIKGNNLPIHGHLIYTKGSFQDERKVGIATRDVDIIYHLGLAWPDDEKDFLSQNIDGTLNLLKAADKRGIKHFLFASSAAVYGKIQYTPIDEKHPCIPTKKYVRPNYSLCKYLTEELCRGFGSSFPVTAFRIGWVFGGAGANVKWPGQEYFEKIVENKEITVIKNTGFDWVHADDVANAFISATLNKKAYNEVFNLSSGFIAEEELARYIKKKMKSKVKIKLKNNGNALNMAAAKARSVLRWNPKSRKKELLEFVNKKIAEAVPKTYFIQPV